VVKGRGMGRVYHVLGRNRWPAGHAMALGGILVLAAVLRLAGLERLSLWADEGYSVALSSLAPGDIVAGTATAQHPPLYYLLLHGWMQVAGSSAFAVRLFSALWGWLTVLLVFRVGHHLERAELREPSDWLGGPGLVAAGLLAVSPAHIWYSQEARMYSLLVLLTALSTWWAWRWWTDEAARTWARTLLYGLVTLAALYTHYFAIFVIVAQNLAAFFLSWLRPEPLWIEGNRWRLARCWLIAQGIWIVGFVPWIPVMVFQTTSHEMTWIPPVDWPAVRGSWLYLLYGAEWQGRWQDVLGALLGLGLMALALWVSLRRSHGEERAAPLRWLALWFWLPALLIVAVARALLIYQDKQLLILLPPLLLLIAVGVGRFRRPVARALAVLAILALLAGPLHEQYVQTEKQGWRELAAYLDARAQPGDLVYLNPYAGKLTFDYYSEAQLPQAGYPPEYTLLQGGWVGEIATPQVIAAQIDPIAQEYARIWLVDFVPEFWDPEGLILARLEHYYRQVESHDFHGVRLVLFSRRAMP
jgi:mannosyltransferase